MSGLLTHRLNVPAEVRDAVRVALATKPAEVPDVAYRLASGWALPDDREQIALWCLDHGDQFESHRYTATAGLRGGNAGMRWAMTAALTGIVDPALVEAQLGETVRSDQMLIPMVAAAIRVGWDRQMDHAARKARSRLMRSTEGKQIDFIGWPNPEAARRVGVDDLMDRAWDALVASLTGMFIDYARTQAAIVAVADATAAESVRNLIQARVPVVINALVGFLDQRAREFVFGEVPFEPQDFAAARTITSWLSGASPAPEGFSFEELSIARFTTGLSTAQEALLALLVNRLSRAFVWVHSFYGQPRVPFPPHEAISGQTFSQTEMASLLLFPGDHVGCLCELIPVWTLA